MELMHPKPNKPIPMLDDADDAYDDFDYGTIEQIANGLEKMVGSWTLNSQGRALPTAYNNNSLELDFLEEEEEEEEEEENGYAGPFDDEVQAHPQSHIVDEQYESDTAEESCLNAANAEYPSAGEVGNDQEEEVEDGEVELEVIDPLDIPGIPSGKEFHAEIRNDDPPDAMENFKFQLDENISIDDTTLMFSAREPALQVASSSDSGIYEEDKADAPNNFELEAGCSEGPENPSDLLREKTRPWRAEECRSSTSASSSCGHRGVVEEEEEEEEEEDHQSRKTYIKYASKPNPAKMDQRLDPIRKVMGWKESRHPPAKPHTVPRHKLGLRKKYMEPKQDVKKPCAIQKRAQRRNDIKPDQFEWTSGFKDSNLTSSDMLYSGDGSSNEEMAKHYPSTYSVSLNQELEELRIDHPAADEELKMDLLAQVKEYEAKLLEMKMKTLQLQSQFQSSDSGAFPKKDKSRKIENSPLLSNMEKSEERKLESCKKQIMKLQREKDSLIKEIHDLKRKERQFELQRQSLDETQQRANLLQRELIKKEEDLVEWQLREKKADAELHQAEVALQRVRGTYLDPHKILNLVPALCAWLQSLKKIGPVRCEHRQLLQVQHFEASLLKILDECIPMDELQVSLTNSPAVVDIHSIAPYRTNQAISIYDR